MALLGSACGTGILWLGMSEWSDAIGFSQILNLERGRLIEFFSTLTLLLTSQLSFLIFWYRSRSRKDFGGRYRIWGWAGCFWGGVCLCTATGVHRPLAEAALARWPVDCWRPLTTYWLTPLAIGFIAISRLLALEMCHSRLSRICWNIVFWWGLLAGLLHLGLETVLPESVRVPTVAGITLFWHLSLALSLLIHARFVVHVTNEAAPRKLSWTARSLRSLRLRLQPWFESLRVRKAAAKPSAESAPANRRTKRPAAETTVQQSARKPERKTETAQPAVAAEAPKGDPETRRSWWGGKKKQRVLGKTVRLDSPAAVPEPHAAPAQAARPPARSEPVASVPLPKPAQRPSVDSDDEDETDDAETRRLSKKERRRLRKLRQSA